VLDEAESSDLSDVPYRVSFEDGWHRLTRFERFRAVADIFRRYERDSDVFHVYSASWIPAAGHYRADGRVPIVATLHSYSLWCTNGDRIDGRCQLTCGVMPRLRHASTPPMRKLLSWPARALEQYVAFPWTQHVDHFLPNSPTTKRMPASTSRAARSFRS
jgi:hypothetical protein